MIKYLCSFIAAIFGGLAVAILLSVGYMVGVRDGKVIGERIKAEEIRIALLTEHRVGMSRPLRIPLNGCDIEVYMMNHKGMPRDVIIRDVRDR